MVTLPGKRSRYHLLLLSAWRHAGQHRWQSALSFIGIMLGVMMVVAVDLASTSAARAFDYSVASVSGTITHQITGGSSGVPDDIFTQLRTQLGLVRSAPVISAQVQVRGRRLTMQGLDLISELSLARARGGFSQSAGSLTPQAFTALARPGAVLMSASSALALSLTVGDEFTLDSPLGTTVLHLLELLPGEQAELADSLMFVDIATAQLLLGRQGRIDSIDLILTAAEVDQVSAWLPANLSLVNAESRNVSLEQMTEAFRINLLAMSLLALLVAGLLIYNTVSLSVLERRSVFGVYRALGLSRTQLISLVLGESVVLGMLASIAGVLAGTLLGRSLVTLVTRTIDDLYFNLTVTGFLLEPLVLLKGLAWGLGITVLAAALPAWQAGSCPPVTLQLVGEESQPLTRRLTLLGVVGVLMMLVGWALLLPAEGGLLAGFVSLNLLVFGFCLLVPMGLYLCVQGLLKAAGPALRYPLRLALRSIHNGLDRTALAVAALTVAISVTVGVGVMVGSFRDTVVLWLEQTLEGDVQVTRLDDGGIDPVLESTLQRLPELASLTRGYTIKSESSVGQVRVLAQSGEPANWLYMKSQIAADKMSDDTVWVAEPLAWLHGLGLGDSIRVQTAAGMQTLAISGIFYDYSTADGMLALTREQFLRYYPDTEPTRLTLTASDSTDVLLQAVRAQTRKLEGDYGVAANAQIREITLAIFDRTFAITHVLRLLSVLVAFVGILCAMIALQLQRMREYAVLRATGMTVREVAGMILVQTAAMGVLAGLFALPLGLMMSDVLIDVINQRSFGWSMQHSVPVAVLGQALLLALGAGLLAGIYPALRVARVDPATALRQE